MREKKIAWDRTRRVNESFQMKRLGTSTGEKEPFRSRGFHDCNNMYLIDRYFSLGSCFELDRVWICNGNRQPRKDRKDQLRGFRNARANLKALPLVPVRTRPLSNGSAVCVTGKSVHVLAWPPEQGLDLRKTSLDPASELLKPPNPAVPALTMACSEWTTPKALED